MDNEPQIEQSVIQELLTRVGELEDNQKKAESKRLHQTDIPPKTIKQRHLEGLIIFTGTAANRPDGTTEVQAYFATDTFVLSLYTGSAWKSTTLS